MKQATERDLPGLVVVGEVDVGGRSPDPSDRANDVRFTAVDAEWDGHPQADLQLAALDESARNNSGVRHAAIVGTVGVGVGLDLAGGGGRRGRGVRHLSFGGGVAAGIGT